MATQIEEDSFCVVEGTLLLNWSFEVVGGIFFLVFNPVW